MLRHLFLILLLVLPQFACSSTGGGSSSGLAGEVPLVMTLTDKAGLRLPMVSDAWLRSKDTPGETFIHRRAAFYSQVMSGDNSHVKVIDDEMAEGVWAAFRSEGFDRVSREGPATNSGAQLVGVIEIVTESGTQHLGSYAGMTDKEAEVYLKCKAGLVDLYNITLKLGSANKLPEFKKPGER